jgi:hypothetical protein
MKMRKIHIFLIAIICLVSSCGDRGTDTLFYVKNRSNHNVKLTLFNANIQGISQSIDTTYIMPNLSEITNFVSMKGNNDYSLLPFGSPDSARIIFDDNLKISFKRDDSKSRNILHFENYTGGKADDRRYEFTYTITEDDYKNAKPIK